MSPREALRIVLLREHLRRTLRIAIAVGLVVTAISQGDIILRGDATTGTWLKTALNLCVPFIVSNLGLLAGSAGRNASQDAGTPDW